MIVLRLTFKEVDMSLTRKGNMKRLENFSMETWKEEKS